MVELRAQHVRGGTEMPSLCCTAGQLRGLCHTVPVPSTEGALVEGDPCPAGRVCAVWPRMGTCSALESFPSPLCSTLRRRRNPGVELWD